ncbi:MAG: Ankyrin repeat and BTB/POZ domain-containing protein 1 [Lichina confinis]|nr:MAG: Ankyrin repeat and BTB/POZ domain-containing protein 1 [Lichina confinis]
MVSKDLQSQLLDERQLIREGRLKDENPLDESSSFTALCDACRKGDARGVMVEIGRGLKVQDDELTRDVDAHKFILAARSPFFRRRVASGQASFWEPSNVRPEAIEMAIKFIYLSESATDVPTTVPESAEQDFLRVLERLSRQLEIPQFWHSVIDCGDRRISRQRRSDEFVRCQAQVQEWYQDSVLKHSFVVDKDQADKVRWDRSNSIFADVLLRADDVDDEDESASEEDSSSGRSESIPIGPMAPASQSPSRVRRPTTSTLFPAHRAMLIRSEFFLTMFSSSFKEAQSTEHLQIVRVDCAPRVLEVVLAFLYTDQVEIPPDIGAKWLAGHLEFYIEDEDFAALIAESASRIQKRQETDSIELLDDIRHYLSERFRLRFEDQGLEEMMNEEAQVEAHPIQNEDQQPESASGEIDSKTGNPGGKGDHRTATPRSGQLLTMDAVQESDEDDEFVAEAVKYKALLQKIDLLLERLQLDA